MARIHNFSAGPGVLPESVLREAQAALWEHGSHGIGILECSHRSVQFDAVMDSAKARLRRLMKLSDDQHILFLQGGARSQFHMVPMNLLRGGTAVYLDTGVWASGAAKEAQRFGNAVTAWSSKATGWDRLPAPGAWGPLPEGTKYLHYTSNNTVAGTEFGYVPDPQGAWLVCDMSSDLLAAPVDGSRFDLIYAGAQKNIGPAGVTLVVIRDALLAACDPDVPSMLSYPIEVEKDSMLNTPNTFGIFVIDRVLAWLEDEVGGLEAMAARNARQAAAVYDAIDASALFRGKVDPAARSKMNLTFTTGDADLDTRFHKEALAAGLSGLKGHRSVGGLRASLYNAQTDAAVDALVAFLQDFERTHGSR